MNFVGKSTLFLSMLIGTSLYSSNAIDGDIGQPEESPAAIMQSQDLEYLTSMYTDLIKKNKTLAELNVYLEKARSNFETTRDRLEEFLENGKLKDLYNQHLKEFSEAKSNYVGFYDTLIVKFQQLCNEEGLTHLCSQFLKDITLKEEVSAPLSVAINNPFKKAWALIDANEGKDGARKLFKPLVGLHPYAAQGLIYCSTEKKEIESALLESIRVKLALGKETGLLKDLELLCNYQNTRDANLLLQAAQYYRSQFDKSKNPMMVYNAIRIGTMMPKCQEGTLLLSQIALLNIVSNAHPQASIDNSICYGFMNLCRNQENIESLNVFLKNNNFEGDWYSTKDELFFVQQLENMKDDNELWSHKSNLKVLERISSSSNYSDEIRLLAAKIRFNSVGNKNFNTYFDYYKILKHFNHVDRHKYIGILHNIADFNIQTHPEQLYKVATELGYVLETLPMFMKAADAGCKEALPVIETHDVFLTDEYLESLALFFARHNSVKGIQNLCKQSNSNALLVIARELEERFQPLGTLGITQEYLPLLDLEHVERTAEIKKLEKHISKLKEMIRLINSAQPSVFYEGHVDVTYFYRPTIGEAASTKKNIEQDLNTSKVNLKKNQTWLKMYGSKRPELIESISTENLFSLAKECHLIYQALNTRLRDGQEKTKILKDTYFELLRRAAAQNSQAANDELKDIETNGFNWLLYVLPSEVSHLEELEEFKGINKFFKESFMKQLYSNKPLLISFNEQSGS